MIITCLIPIDNDRFICLDELIIVAGLEEYFGNIPFR